MSKPVPYLSEDVRHDIRNTTDGEFLFVPTELITTALQFILATMARRYNVGIVAYAMMCTHIHLLVVDLSEDEEPSDIPEFRRMVRSTFAQFINAYWGRTGRRAFCPDSVGLTIKVLGSASLEKTIAYIENNPTNEGMEKSPARMKGAVSLREWVLTPLVVRRPDFFFQKRTWNKVEQLELVVPPCARRNGHTRQSFYEATKSAVDARTREIARERKRDGLKAKPLHVLRRLRPENGIGRSSASHKEVLLTCEDPYQAAMEFFQIRAFRNDHSRAMALLKEGRDDVMFPPGTYLAAKRYGARVRPSTNSYRYLDPSPT